MLTKQNHCMHELSKNVTSCTIHNLSSFNRKGNTSLKFILSCTIHNLSSFNRKGNTSLKFILSCHINISLSGHQISCYIFYYKHEFVTHHDMILAALICYIHQNIHFESECLYMEFQLTMQHCESKFVE
jgi:hypothetical protein